MKLNINRGKTAVCQECVFFINTYNITVFLLFNNKQHIVGELFWVTVMVYEIWWLVCRQHRPSLALWISVVWVNRLKCLSIFRSAIRKQTWPQILAQGGKSWFPQPFCSLQKCHSWLQPGEQTLCSLKWFFSAGLKGKWSEVSIKNSSLIFKATEVWCFIHFCRFSTNPKLQLLL